MEEAVSTECLRNLAPHWNLAGDKKLLNLLQDMHQKILTRCQETSTKLEEMAISLDGANIDLQNVNNKFMALSNSQFIESRVYDDDLEVSVEEKPTKIENAAASNQDMEAELAKLKQSLTVLESMHESVRILDSDSDSDTDEGDGRMVFRPKDLYAERPLPHIIGSQAWKSKWHAGIIAEDSDSDSTTSKPENEEPEQYSESDSELTDTRTDRLNPPQRTISSTSSTAESEPCVHPPLSQATVAAELARKLAGNLPQIPVETPESEAEYTKPRVATSQVYKPQNPPTSNIFFDEPPPIDQSYQSDSNDYNDEEDDDIFAELHKSKPSFTANKDQTRVNQDLFGDFNNMPDVSADLFGTEKKESPVQKINDEHLKESDKKPVGGISVFGSSKGTESIGAAILKRNQRKTYSSDEESDKGTFISKDQNSKRINKEQISRHVSASNNIPKDNNDSLESTNVNKDEPISEKKTAVKKEKDVLQDLFDKSKSNKNKKDEQVPAKEQTDIFSDNLFDDIDDIFTDAIVKVPIKEASKNVKSIFDDDDDDLFADIAVTSKKETTSKSVHNKAAVLFDSDDDDYLFSEEKTEIIQKPENNVNKAENITIEKNKETKNIFDDDVEEDLFSDIKIKKSPNEKMKKDTTLASVFKEKIDSVKSNDNKEDEKDDDDSNLFSDNNIAINNAIPRYATNIGEVIVNKATEQVHNIGDNDKLNNSSQIGRDVSFVPQAETSIETSKISSDFEESETIYESSNYREDAVEDDWNDSFADSKNENTHESCEDSKFEDNHNIVAESTTANKTQFENVDTDLTNELLFSETSLPKENNSETKENCKSYSSSNNIEYLQLPPDPSIATDEKPDIFSDIFNDVPPAFEKPKEPKKSKNVNALFDDDSDDEALFFKKNDTVSDEKPDLTSVSQEDNLFRIFSDEPPAIDVDFTQNITKSRRSEIENKQFDSIIPKNPIETLTDSEISNNTGQIPSQTESQIIEKSTEKNTNTESMKSVGKLKMNINIDVNTLLPGGSPKKNKVVEQVDGQVASSRNININDAEDLESKIVKSVSFDGEADSGLLDNKLSKERAKIQVKRRPSTRRARREAVKKSGIDFVNTDIADDTNTVNHPKTLSDKEATKDAVKDTVKDYTKVDNDKEQNIKSKIVYILNDEDIFSNANTNKNAGQNVEAAVSNNKENSQQVTADVSTFDNNDDIFKKMNIAKVQKIPEVSLEKNQNQTNTSTGKTDNVFQNKVDKENQNVITKSQDNSEKITKSKASIFDDLSDDETELFQGKKSHEPKSEPNPKKKNIFGSDSEELFTNNVKKTTVPNEEIPKSTNSKVVVKKSLFDDDSDEDLFSTKASSSGSKPVFSKSNEVKPIQTQSVDEDPLSLLTSDEVDYI